MLTKSAQERTPTPLGDSVQSTSQSERLELQLECNYRFQTCALQGADYNELCATIRASFRLNHFEIGYVDNDGDLISIGCQADLQAAIATFDLKSLKIISEQPNQLQSRAFNMLSSIHEMNESLIFSNQCDASTQTLPAFGPVHNVSCFYCKSTQIVGIRLHCSSCRFNCCEVCEVRAENPHPHPLLRFARPESIDLVTVPSDQ